MVKCVLINKYGVMTEINYENSFDNLYHTKGEGDIQLIITWEFEEGLQVLLYGWEEGDRININKHELPEPIENKLLYGDIIVQLKQDGELIDFDVEDYNEFYENMFGGFESIENTEDDNDENDDYDYTDPFIVDDRE